MDEFLKTKFSLDFQRQHDDNSDHITAQIEMYSIRMRSHDTMMCGVSKKHTQQKRLKITPYFPSYIKQKT